MLRQYLFGLKYMEYTKQLPDKENDRPYCAGQKVLNEVTRQIIALAKANGWSKDRSSHGTRYDGAALLPASCQRRGNP